MALGRPSLYDETYCDEIVEYCKSGASITAFAGSIGVCRDTITEWANVHPNFSLAVKRAKAAAASWYDQQGRKIVESGQGNATLVIFGLKNMAPDDFKDVQERHHSGEVTVNKVSRVFHDANPDNTNS